MNKQLMDMILNMSAGALWSALWTPMIGGCIYLATFLFYPCVWAVRSMLSAIVWGIRNWILGQSWWCKNGLAFNLHFNGRFTIWCQ
jgi:hypothetical protein